MAFKMRSGNGPLAFKNMGSSPAKQSKMTREELTKLQESNKLQEDIVNTKGTDAYKKNQEEIKKKADHEAKVVELNTLQKEKDEGDAKAKVDATRGTSKGQVKKSGRLDKIQNRQDKRALRKYNNSLSQGSQGEMGMEAFKKSDKYTDKTSKREGRLKKEVNMTPDEYDANQAAKKEKFAQGMRDIGELAKAAGDQDISLVDTIKGQADAKVAKADKITARKDQDIQNEKDIANTKRTNHLTAQATANLDAETSKLPDTEVKKGGGIVTTGLTEK